MMRKTRSKGGIFDDADGDDVSMRMRHSPSSLQHLPLPSPVDRKKKNSGGIFSSHIEAMMDKKDVQMLEEEQKLAEGSSGPFSSSTAHPRRDKAIQSFTRNLIATDEDVPINEDLATNDEGEEKSSDTIDNAPAVPKVQKFKIHPGASLSTNKQLLFYPFQRDDHSCLNLDPFSTRSVLWNRSRSNDADKILSNEAMKCVHLVSDKWEELDWQSYNQYSNHDGRDKGNTKINVGSSSSSGGVSSKKRRSDPTEYVASMSQEMDRNLDRSIRRNIWDPHGDGARIPISHSRFLASRLKPNSAAHGGTAKTNTSNNEDVTGAMEVIDLVGDSDSSPIKRAKTSTFSTNQSSTISRPLSKNFNEKDAVIAELNANLLEKNTQIETWLATIQGKDDEIRRLSTHFTPNMDLFKSVEQCEDALLAIDKARTLITEKRKQLLTEDSLCIICMEIKIDTVLIPCGHLKFCWGCVERLPTKTCPCCNIAYRETMKVYSN